MSSVSTKELRTRTISIEEAPPAGTDSSRPSCVSCVTVTIDTKDPRCTLIRHCLPVMEGLLGLYVLRALAKVGTKFGVFRCPDVALSFVDRVEYSSWKDTSHEDSPLFWRDFQAALPAFLTADSFALELDSTSVVKHADASFFVHGSVRIFDGNLLLTLPFKLWTAKQPVSDPRGDTGIDRRIFTYRLAAYASLARNLYYQSIAHLSLLSKRVGEVMGLDAAAFCQPRIDAEFRDVLINLTGATRTLASGNFDASHTCQRRLWGCTAVLHTFFEPASRNRSANARVSLESFAECSSAAYEPSCARHEGEDADL